MVQLKSFRYVETEPTSDRLAGDYSIEQQQSRLTNKENYSTGSSPSSSNEPKASSSPDTLPSIAEGGNLTSSESESSRNIEPDEEPTRNNKQTTNFPKKTPSSIKRPSGGSSSSHSNEEDSSTLSSGQELQTAQHNLTADEDEPSDESSNALAREPNATTKRSSADSTEINVISARLHHMKQQKMATLRNQSSPQLCGAGGNQPPFGQMSPNIFGARKFPKTNSADNLSQFSFSGGHRFNSPAPSSNQFEIRWSNLNLYAKKSDYRQMLIQNPICNLFNRKKSESNEEKRDEKVYYSPPIRHKPVSFSPRSTHGSSTSIGCVNETIKEDSELGPTTSTAIREIIREEYPNSSNNESSSNNNGENVKSVLNNLSGSVFSGQLTAVLGPSGVGKTMLLNSLTGRNTLEGTGRVSLLGSENCKRMSVVTVPQADILPGKLTVLEDLQFTSKLKNPIKGFKHGRNIERIVEHLHMKKFLNTRIDKLSGGEARRLSIGRELLNSPDIMILDEPTSGLDANTCKKIITALRDIVEHSENILDRPMSIIVTIHQPQQEVLNLFHRVYVIARSSLGGRAIYEGPPSNLLSGLLEQSSLSRVCAVEQLNENPAIVALEVASGEYGPQIIEELAFYHENPAYDDYSCHNLDLNQQMSPFLTPKILRAPRKSPLSVSPRFELLQKARMNSSSSALDSARQTPIFNKRLMLADQMSSVTSLSYASTYDADLPVETTKLKVDKRLRRSVVMKGDFLTHTMILMKRCWLLATRDVFLMSIRIIGFLLVAGGTVQIYAGALDKNENQCPSFESEVEDVAGFMSTTRIRLLGLQGFLKQSSSTHLFMFHIILCLTMVTSALTGLVFPLQMRMFMREYKNGWYSIGSFITSQTLAELPVDIIGPTITVLIAYPLCNQPDSPYYLRELGYIVVVVLASVITKSQAQIVGAFLMDSIENSVFISCVLVAPASLLSGLAVRVSTMYWPLQIISFCSHIRYTFESMLVLRYGYGLCPCDPELIHGYPVETTEISVPPQLDKMVRGFLDIYNEQQENNNKTSSQMLAVNSNNSTSSILKYEDNLFVRFIQLVTDARNLFVKDPEQLGDCSTYRSLYLMDMEVKDRIFPQWVGVMVFMFVISRFLTYLAVKIVLRIRRNKRQD